MADSDIIVSLHLVIPFISMFGTHGIFKKLMYICLNLKTIKVYLIKLAVDFYCQTRQLLGETSHCLLQCHVE